MKRKRGRPPKGAKAMTPAERKRKSREEQALFGKPKKPVSKKPPEEEKDVVERALGVVPSGRRVAPPGSLLKGAAKKLLEGL